MIETMRLPLASILTVFAAFAAPQQAPVYGHKIIHIYPHDHNAFTQGLEYRGGFLYEGTGLNGRSSLRKVDLESGKVLQEIRLDSKYFGEGITLVDQRIIELTWQSHQGFVYDRNTFRLIRSFDYPGDGWGLTNDGRQIYMSDGTAQIRFWNPSTLQEIRRITVHDGPAPVDQLNDVNRAEHPPS